MTSIDIDALWKFDQPGESEARFQALFSEPSADLSPDLRVEVLTQIARAQGLQGRFADGHATLGEADSIPHAEEGRAAVRLLLERGRLFNSAGDVAPAVSLFRLAIATAERCGEAALAIDAAHMLGIATPADTQLEWNLKALAMAENATDPTARGWTGSLLNNIGWTYHDRGEFEAALQAFERAVRFRRDVGQMRETRIAEWSVARAMRSLGRMDDALEIQYRLSKELRFAGEEDPYVEEELGECLIALGRATEARSHFAAAYAGLSQDACLRAHEPKRLEHLRRNAGLVD